MRYYVLAISSLLWIATVQATPTGNHTCTGVVKHSVTVRVNVTEPVTFRTYTWCLKVPPRCSKYTVQLKDRVKIHTEMHNRTITVCCKGYVEMDYKCVPACPPQTECANMHCNRTNHCYCTPGYQGLYCNYPCDRGFWGTDCKKTCDCPVGFTCHHLTGDCMIDDRPATKSRRTTTTTAATFSPETTNTEDRRTTATSHILTKSTAVRTTSIPSTTTAQNQGTILRTTQERTTSTVSVTSTTPGLSVKIHVEDHNSQHRENNILTTKAPISEPDSSTSNSVTEIKYDVTKKVVVPENFFEITLGSAKQEEATTLPTNELFGKQPNLSETTLEGTTTTLTAATESSLVPNLISSTPSKAGTILELATTSSLPVTSAASPIVEVTTSVPSEDVSTTSTLSTLSSTTEDLRTTLTKITTIGTKPGVTSSTVSVLNKIPVVTNIFDEITSTTSSTLPTTISNQDELASTSNTLPRTIIKARDEVSSTLKPLTPTPGTLDELTSTTISTTLKPFADLTSLSSAMPSEPKTLEEVTVISSSLPTTLGTSGELISLSKTSSVKSTTDELTTLLTISSSTPTILNELTASILPKTQSTLEEMTSTGVPKTTVESPTTPSTLNELTSNTMSTTSSIILKVLSSSPEKYTVSNPMFTTPKPSSSATFPSSFKHFTLYHSLLPSNERLPGTDSSSTVSTLSNKSTMSFNELNKTVDQNINLTTSSLQIVPPAIQTHSGNDRFSETELSTNVPSTELHTTSYPYVSREIIRGESFDFPITTSAEILSNLENTEMKTIKITTVHPMEEFTIRKESDAINVNLESTSELMKTIETDRRSGVERNEDLDIFTKEVPHSQLVSVTPTEPKILSTTESIKIAQETFVFHLDKLLGKTEIKNSSSSTIKTMDPDSFHGKYLKMNDSDNDSVIETSTDQGRHDENVKKTIKKVMLNDTNLISGINEVSTIFDGEKLDDNEENLKQKPELVTTLTTKEETSSNMPLWITTNSRPAHTWYSHNRENQRKMKNKDDMKATSHLDTQIVTERYDMSEESNVIDSMLTTFAEKGSRSNSVAPVFVNEEANIPSSYLNNGQIKYNMSGALAEEVQAGRDENSVFTLYSASTLISAIALILFLATSTAVCLCLRTRREPTTLRRPCIMAYGTPNEVSLNPLMYETVYPLESIAEERCVDPDIFFCPTFTNNYAEKINRELSELNYDHPRSSICEPLYAEIRY